MCNPSNCLRYVGDLGMFAIDRDMASCNGVRSPHCAKQCYNFKFFKMYAKNMDPFERTLRDRWSTINGASVRAEIKRKRKSVDRVRFCTRGETVPTIADMCKVREICAANPAVSFWMPTKSWRDPSLRDALLSLKRDCPNLAILASVDPSCTDDQWAWIEDSGLSVMFFGDDSVERLPVSARHHWCAKTWLHEKQACSTCHSGCFADISGDRVAIILKSH